MVGTIGPLVQGALPRLRCRLEITVLFAAGFLGGAVVIFSLAFLAGAAFHLHEVAAESRRWIAVVGLVALALLDLWARSRRTWCPITLRRQTPRRLRRGHSLRFLASAWGFDTGLAVTTFRVTAATWGAVLLAILGLSGWQTGIAYGIAFTVPVIFLMWTHRAGRMAVTLEPGDPGLGELLARRPAWQVISAIALAGSAVMLAGSLLLGVP